MSQKVKVFISVLLVMGLLVMGGTAAALAQEETAPTPEKMSPALQTNGCLAKVAEILEIPQEKLIAAFQQVCREVREGALTRVRDRIMEQECIAKNSALQVKRCLKSRLMISGCTLSNAPISQRN